MIDDVDSLKALFTRSDGCFRFARWTRPLAPMIAGTDDRGVRLFEQQIAAVAALAGVGTADLDPESGANFLVFFVGDWAELAEIPALANLIPGIAGLAARLERAQATHYRVFGFDPEGAIGICVTLIRYGPELMKVSAQTLALTQAFQGILLWAERVFDDISPTALDGEDRRCVIKPWFRRLLRAAYDPVIPPVSIDSALALRLAARMGPSDAAESAEMAAEQIAGAVAAAASAGETGTGDPVEAGPGADDEAERDAGPATGDGAHAGGGEPGAAGNNPESPQVSPGQAALQEAGADVEMIEDAQVGDAQVADMQVDGADAEDAVTGSVAPRDVAGDDAGDDDGDDAGDDDGDGAGEDPGPDAPRAAAGRREAGG